MYKYLFLLFVILLQLNYADDFEDIDSAELKMLEAEHKTQIDKNETTKREVAKEIKKNSSVQTSLKVDRSSNIKIEKPKSATMHKKGLAPIHPCDEFAADPNDPIIKKIDIGGIIFETIEADKAVSNCQSAVTAYPNESRFQYELARALEKKRDIVKAAKLYLKVAKNGYKGSFWSAGRVYYFGWGVPIDYKKALQYWQKASKIGNNQAMLDIAMLYIDGKGVEVNEKIAHKWFLKAAKSENEKAMFFLAHQFQIGEGTKRNIREAVKWYKKAAQLGQANAYYELSRIYLLWKTGNSKVKKAAELFVQAIASGYPLIEDEIPQRLSKRYWRAVQKNLIQDYGEKIAITGRYDKQTQKALKKLENEAKKYGGSFLQVYW